MDGRPRFSWRGVVLGGLAAIVAAGVLFGWRVSQVLRQSSRELRAEQEIRILVRPYRPSLNTGFETISSTAVFLQAARFQDHLYIAGPAGLSEYDLAGGPGRHFSVGRELPSSPIVAISPAALADTREPELVIATAGDGLLGFNGAGFRQIYPQDADSRAITSILPVAAGHLLLGTKKRGVLLYDGKQITALHASLGKLYVTALAGSESDLWIGTLNQGVFHWHAGTAESFSEEQGLPDRQVQCLAVAGENAYVGTPVGVALFEGGRFSRVLAPGVFTTSLLPTSSRLLVGSESQGVISIPLDKRPIGHISGVASQLADIRQFLSSGDETYALTRNALFRATSRGAGWQQVLSPGPAALSDRNISALAGDADGGLWIGYFDRGLDLLQPESGRATHVEDDHVFCVNRILPDPKTGTVAVATANGLVRFSASGSQEQVLTRADGLIADHVTDVAVYRGGLAVATPAGLTFLDAAGARSMYAFHGLVNNHVYALGASGDDLLVGTLGGLSVLGKETVRVNYTAGAASGLKHNWITAVVPVGEEWMVGTYGAGILSFDRAGHFHSFEKATGPFEINPAAMLVTPSHVFAGSLGRGLYVYDRATARWRVVTEGLPSPNVTALAESRGYVYVGTDNGLVRIEEQKLLP